MASYPDEIYSGISPPSKMDNPRPSGPVVTPFGLMWLTINANTSHEIASYRPRTIETKIFLPNEKERENSVAKAALPTVNFRKSGIDFALAVYITRTQREEGGEWVTQPQVGLTRISDKGRGVPDGAMKAASPEVAKFARTFTESPVYRAYEVAALRHEAVYEYNRAQVNIFDARRTVAQRVHDAEGVQDRYVDFLRRLGSEYDELAMYVSYIRD